MVDNNGWLWTNDCMSSKDSEEREREKKREARDRDWKGQMYGEKEEVHTHILNLVLHVYYCPTIVE